MLTVIVKVTLAPTFGVELSTVLTTDKSALQFSVSNVVVAVTEIGHPGTEIEY